MNTTFSNLLSYILDVETSQLYGEENITISFFSWFNRKRRFLERYYFLDHSETHWIVCFSVRDGSFSPFFPSVSQSRGQS